MCILAAERLLGTSLRLGRQSAVWIGGSVTAVTLSYLPEGWNWAPVRFALGVLAIAGLLLALRALRNAFNSATDGVPLRAVEEGGS